MAVFIPRAVSKYRQTTCRFGRETGVCKNEKDCNGFTRDGLCPGGANNKCCFSASCKDGAVKGTCKNVKDCNGRTKKGLCPGPNEVQCCLPSGERPPHPSPRPQPQTPGWVVSLGDSLVAGDGVRWGGNSNKFNITATDALGPNSYSGEHCMRSTGAEIHIGNGIQSKNFACTGGRLVSGMRGAPITGTKIFISGVDFYNVNGNKGQALQLQEWAVGKKIDMILVGIGINEFGFADTIMECGLDFLKPNFLKKFCKDDPKIKSNVSPAHIAEATNNLATAMKNTVLAMTNAGHAPGTYTLLTQTYFSIFPHPSKFRYPDSGYDRQLKGGCPVRDADAVWLNTVFLSAVNKAVLDAVAKFKASDPVSKIKVVRLDHLLEGRRLCEKGMNVIEHSGVKKWNSPNASDKLEWINQVRTLSVLGDYELLEDGHPNFFASMAIRNCLRQAYNNGNPVGGWCKRRDGVNDRGEPNVDLVDKN